MIAPLTKSNINVIGKSSMSKVNCEIINKVAVQASMPIAILTKPTQKTVALSNSGKDASGGPSSSTVSVLQDLENAEELTN